MVWIKRLLIGLGALFVVLVLAVVAINVFGDTGDNNGASTSVSVGGRTVLVSGNYKHARTYALNNGMKVVVDGHRITVDKDGKVTLDDKPQQIRDFKTLKISISKDGSVRFDPGSS